MPDMPQFPTGVDRRAFSLAAEPANNYIQEPASIATSPLSDCPTRKYITGLLDRELLNARNSGVPICLVVSELLPKPADNLPAQFMHEALYAVSKIFRSHLRPNDIILRYRDILLALILPASDDPGGRSVCARLDRAVSQRLFFGSSNICVQPIFGVASQLSQQKVSGEQILAAAESDLLRIKLELSR
jgi:GGDEF domain-containing protein